MSEYPEHLRKSRMKEDAEFINAPEQWPSDTICMKTQPWVEPRRFAVLSKPKCSTYTVLVNDGTSEEFGSVNELVKVWSID